jgi:murein DD-endopeptidase MepM/ murein hydrolase activator NlpD
MSAVLESLRKSSINIQNISKTLSDTKKSTSSVNNSVDNISRIVATNTRVKRELFTRSNILSYRREEASKRQELEDRIESTRVSTSPQAGLSFSSRSEKGPLGRLLGFLGFITAGWIVENLPRWIFMGKEFISRIYSFGRSMYGMVNSMQVIIKSFGQTLGYSLNAIVRLDFDEFAGEGTVARSFEELNLAVQGLGDDLTKTFRLFTTPLNQSVETGEQAPALDEKQPDTMFPGVQQEPGAYSETPTPGNLGPATNLVSGARAIMNAGFPAKGAAYLAGNIQQESGWRGQRDPWVLNDGAGTNKGLVSWNQGRITNAEKFLGKPLNKASNSDQIRWIKQEMQKSYPDAYKIFMNPNASDADLQKASYIYLGYGEVGSRFAYANKAYADLQKGGSTSQSTPAQTSTPTTGKSFNPLPGGSFKDGESQRFGASRDGGDRKHLGLDITESNWKAGSDPRIPVVAIRGGIVSQKDYVGGSQYLSGLVIDQDDGYSVRYLHMSPSVRPGQKVSAGQRIGRLVNLGNQTHLHIELYSGSKLLDPTNYIKTVEKGGVPPSIATRQPKTPSLSPAQISAQPKAQQPAAMTPERKGSQMLFIDATQPQAPQTSYPSQQQPSATPTISEFKLLNNFIKNKLLLDLAYL